MQNSQRPAPSEQGEHSSAIASLRLHFLGSPRFTNDETPIELSATKATALLAYLALTHLPQARDHLLRFLWAESAPEAARKNLRNTLWTLRKTLGGEVVHASADHLAINKTVWVDVWEFERLAASHGPTLQAGKKVYTENANSRSSGDLRQSITNHLQAAVALYRGPFLQNLALMDAPEFDVWMIAERERLGRLYARIQATLIDAYRAKGSWGAIITLAQQALSHDPLQEPMYRVLMEAYAHLGERAQAINLYTALCTLLTRELDVEPLPETKALYLAITRGDIQTTTTLYEDAVSVYEHHSFLDKPLHVPFIGRGAEFAVLDAELKRAGSGSARIILLIGELGVGKSRLWQEWSSGLGSNRAILETRCLESVQTLPFVPLVELFGSQNCVQCLFVVSCRLRDY